MVNEDAWKSYFDFKKNSELTEYYYDLSAPYSRTVLSASVGTAERKTAWSSGAAAASCRQAAST